MADDELRGLAERLQGICLGKGITVALAESCTGGLVATAITEVSGSSGYFLGGVVSYSDRAKAAFLDVPEPMLAAHGAVSAQVGRAMASGARRRFGATIAGSVTGVAGPEGGSAEKPVGLTYIGVSDGGGDDVRRYVWSGDRATNRHASARAALELLIERAEQAESSEATRP